MRRRMEELKNKILQAMQSDFIGDVQFDEDEITQMKEDCKKFYRAAQNTWSKYYKREDICELIVLIVNIAKSWNDESEGRFWTKLFGEIFEDSSISPIKFYNDFENCLNAYNKTLFRSKENKRMFREVFLLHAFAPEKSGESFIRLLWNWYSDIDVINFDYQHNDALYTQLALFLNKEFGGKTDFDEDVDFEGKTYSIKSSFKYLFSQNKEVGIALLDSLFSNFDDIYFNGKYNKDSFYAERCSTIVEKILQESDIKTERRKRHHTEHIVSDYSKIYAGYEIDEQGVASLFITEIRAIDEEAEEYLVEVLNNEELVYSDEGYIVGNNIKRRIKRISIPFSSFINKLEDKIDIVIKLSVIRDGDEVEIFNSKKSLFRDFILFKGNRETRSDNCKPNVSYYLVHAPRLNISKFTNCSVKDINAYTSTIFPEENNYITTSNQQVFFNIIPKDSHVILDGRRYENTIYQKDGIEYPFFKSVKTISVIIPKTTNADSITVTVDDEKHYPLSACAVANDNTFVIDTAKINTDGSGAHKILFSDVRQKKLLHTVLYYITRDVGVHVTGSNYLFGAKTVNALLQAHNGGESATLYSINPRVGSEKVEFDYDEGTIVIDLPYIKWRIDDGEWNYSELDKKIWHKEPFLHSNCIVEIENNSQLTTELFINDQRINLSKSGKYLLGDALTDANANRENAIYLSISGVKHLLFEVLNKEELSDFDIDIEEKTVDLSRGFIGDDDARFLIRLTNEDNEYEFETSIIDTFEEDIIDGEYDVEIYLVDFFDNKTLLLDGGFVIGNPDKFCFDDCRIVLTKFNRPNVGKVKLQNSYIADLKYLREETIGSVYSGVLIDKRMKYDVEVYKKDERSLKFYFVKGEDLLPIGFDLTKNAFTQSTIDDKNIISCTSCYYDVEEI